MHVDSPCADKNCSMEDRIVKVHKTKPALKKVPFWIWQMYDCSYCDVDWWPLLLGLLMFFVLYTHWSGLGRRGLGVTLISFDICDYCRSSADRQVISGDLSPGPADWLSLCGAGLLGWERGGWGAHHNTWLHYVHWDSLQGKWYTFM